MQFYIPAGINECRYFFQNKISFNKRDIMLYKTGISFFLEINTADYIIKTSYINSNRKHYGGYLFEFTIEELFFTSNSLHYINDDKRYKIYFKNLKELDLVIDEMLKTLKILYAYYGKEYVGLKPVNGMITKNSTIIEQFVAFSEIANYNFYDFIMESRNQVILIITNFYYWKEHNFEKYGINNEKKAEMIKNFYML